MSTSNQGKAPPPALPKWEVTQVTGVTGSHDADLSEENLQHLTRDEGLQGVTTGERIFEKFALRYVQRDFCVFPLAPGSKKPLQGSHGLSEATADIDAVARMARKHPFANIGLATGPESGICAIDIDPLSGGFETEHCLRADGKIWPQTPVQRTRSGGRHIILEHHPSIITGSNRLGPGIDFRGAGGYVVAAPSIVHGKRYSWLAWPSCGPSPVPSWLLDHLAAEAAKKQANKPSPARPLPVELGPALERARNALCFIPSHDRETWLAVGMALSGSFGESGRDLWDQWSKQSEKYTDAGQAKAWRSFKGSARTVGTIFWLRGQYRCRAPIYSL